MLGIILTIRDIFRALISRGADTFLMSIGGAYSAIFISAIVSSQSDFSLMTSDLSTHTLFISSVCGALGFYLFILLLFYRVLAAKNEEKYCSILISAFAGAAFIFMKLLLNRLGFENEESEILSKSYIIILLVCIIAPIVEEFFFRGLLWKLYRSRDITEPAILFATTILFSISHSPTNLFEYFQFLFAGLCLGILRIYSRSVYLGILAHAIANCIVLFKL